MTDDWSDEETEDPLVADTRNFYKVEKWTRDGALVKIAMAITPRESPRWCATRGCHSSHVVRICI